jgi:hypothetical protein
MAGYSVFTKISGEDGLSGLFRKVAGAAKDATTPVSAFNKAVGEPSTTALGRVGAMVDRVGGKFRAGLSSITQWAPALGALGAVASLSGLFGLAKSAADGFGKITDASEKLGMSAKELSTWRFAFKTVGVESEAVDKAFVKLNKTMYDAATGKNKDVAALFKAMKIPLVDARGHTLRAKDALDDIAEAISKTGNEQTRIAMATALFGKSGADLLPFLIKGREGIAALREEMKKFGAGLNDSQMKALGELDDNFDYAGKAASGLATRLGATMAPALNKILTFTTEWIVANRELIAQAVERKLDKIGRGLELVAAVGSDIANMPVVAEFLKGQNASDAFDAALVVLGATMAGPLFAAFQVVTGAIIRMNAALLTNPFVAAGVLLAGVGIKIVKNWTEVKEVFASAYEKFGVLGVAFQLINVPVNALFESINDVTKALFGIDLDAWGKAAEDAIGRAVDWAIGKLGELLAFFRKVWEPIESGMNWLGSIGSKGASLVGGGNTFGGQTYGGQTFGGNTFGGARFGASAPAPGTSVAVAPPPQRAQVDVRVDFNNVPKGAETSVATKGNVDVSAQVGRSMEVVF